MFGLATTIFSLARLAERQSHPELAASLITAVIGDFGGRRFIIAPDRVESVVAWRDALTEQLGEEAMARAANRVAGKTLGQVFDLAEEETKI